MGIEVDGGLLDYDAVGVDPQVAALLLQDSLAVAIDLEGQGMNYTHVVDGEQIIAYVDFGVLGTVGIDTARLPEVTAKDVVIGTLAEARHLRRELINHLRSLANQLESLDEAANVARLNGEESADGSEA